MLERPRMRIRNSDRIGIIHVCRLRLVLQNWRGMLLEPFLPSFFEFAEADLPIAVQQLVDAGVVRRVLNYFSNWEVDDYGRQIMDAIAPPRIKRDDALTLAHKFQQHLLTLVDNEDSAFWIQRLTLGCEFFSPTTALPFLPVDIYIQAKKDQHVDPRALELELSELSQSLLVRVFVKEAKLAEPVPPDSIVIHDNKRPNP